MGRFESLWESYRRQVMHPQAIPVQVVECRRAFYAGASAFYALLMNGLGTASGSDEPAPEDLALLDGIAKELAGFAESVKAGRA